MSDKPDKTRRALLTGAAAVAGGAVVAAATATEASAADGQPVVAGRANTATQATYLTSSTTGRGLTVTTTNSATTAHAVGAYAKNGSGLIAESTYSHGALLRTKSARAWGAWIANQSPANGTGGALRADGGLGIALSATTDAIDSKPAIRARSNAESGTGVEAFAGRSGVAVRAMTPPEGSAVAVYAVDDNGFGRALVGIGHNLLGGDTQVVGTLSKTAGSFKIDHPLDPANKYLSHSFVESPDMLNVYTGVVTADASGSAVVSLPDWFDALNRDFTYQLTPIGRPREQVYVSAEISDGSFTLAGAHPGQRISWQVTGIRQDAYAEDHRIPVESPKPAGERGTYLYPEGFGKPLSAGFTSAVKARFTTE